MIVVAAFFGLVALFGILLALLELAAWQNSPAPSVTSMGGMGCGVFVVAGILGLVFLAGAFV